MLLLNSKKTGEEQEPGAAALEREHGSAPEGIGRRRSSARHLEQRGQCSGRGRMRPQRWQLVERGEEERLEAREGEELRLTVPLLDLHGARPSG
jgi:hypothetical protein